MKSCQICCEPKLFRNKNPKIFSPNIYLFEKKTEMCEYDTLKASQIYLYTWWLPKHSYLCLFIKNLSNLSLQHILEIKFFRNRFFALRNFSTCSNANFCFESFKFFVSIFGKWKYLFLKNWINWLNSQTFTLSLSQNHELLKSHHKAIFC